MRMLPGRQFLDHISTHVAMSTKGKWPVVGGRWSVVGRLNMIFVYTYILYKQVARFRVLRRYPNPNWHSMESPGRRVRIACARFLGECSSHRAIRAHRLQWWICETRAIRIWYAPPVVT